MEFSTNILLYLRSDTTFKAIHHSVTESGKLLLKKLSLLLLFAIIIIERKYFVKWNITSGFRVSGKIG